MSVRNMPLGVEGLFRSAPEEEPFAIRVDPREQVIRKKSCRIAASRARKRGGRRQEK